MSRKVEFQRKGYVLIKELLRESEVQATVQNLDRLSANEQGIGGWTIPDGVTQSECFWPLIFNRRLLETVRALIGDNIRFLQHNDLHVNFSSYNWHRDSVSRKLGEGADWNETDRYCIVRIGFYLQPRAASSFQLGLLPGTHRLPSPSDARDRQRLENLTGNLNVLRRIASGRSPSPAPAEWLSPANGDAVIFDPRVIHTGSRASGHKYSVFLAYGVPNSHFIHHATYYRFLRPELSYQPMPAVLVDQLKAAGLYQEIDYADRHIPGATIPGFMQSLIARRIRHRPLTKG